MAVYFFDSSAIIKRYVREAGTAWLLGLVDPMKGHHSYLARITGVEVASAVARQQRGGSLSSAVASRVMAQFRHDFAQEYRVIELTPSLTAAAMALAEVHSLRAYDAVQLAAAIEVNRQYAAVGLAMTLISADIALNAAAAAEGLVVDDPNAHP